MAGQNSDVAVVGGGIIGSATAFFLRELGLLRHDHRLEKDSSYQFASTARSAASIRQQFTTPVSTRMSQFRSTSWQASATASGRTARSRSCAARTCCWPMRRGKRCCAPATRPSSSSAPRSPGLTGMGWRRASPGSTPRTSSRHARPRRRGLVRRLHAAAATAAGQARNLGVTYVDKEVVAFERDGGRITALRCADGETFGCGTSSTRPARAAGRVAALAGCALPVEPRKRTMFVIQAPLDPVGMPFVFDTSGIALRPEGDRFICSALPAGGARPPPRRGSRARSLPVRRRRLAGMAHRVPALERLRLQSAWAGHYDMNLFDHNGVVGRHPEVGNFIFANGFSGHGVMHAPATGRGVAELVLHDRYVSLDLSPLAYERIAANQPIREALVY